MIYTSIRHTGKLSFRCICEGVCNEIKERLKMIQSMLQENVAVTARDKYKAKPPPSSQHKRRGDTPKRDSFHRSLIYSIPFHWARRHTIRHMY